MYMYNTYVACATQHQACTDEFGRKKSLSHSSQLTAGAFHVFFPNMIPGTWYLVYICVGLSREFYSSTSIPIIPTSTIVRTCPRQIPWACTGTILPLRGLKTHAQIREPQRQQLQQQQLTLLATHPPQSSRLLPRLLPRRRRRRCCRCCCRY